MTARRFFRRAAPSRLLLLLVFACLGASLTACARPRPAPRLPGRAGIRLRAAAGSYLRFVITPGFDPVVVRQWSHDGKLVQEAEVQADPDQPTHLSWLVDESGVYDFTVSLAPGAPRAAGVYAMAVEEQGAAGPCDAARLRAERRAEAAAVAEMSRSWSPPAEDFELAVRRERASGALYAEGRLHQWRGENLARDGDAEGAIAEYHLALDGEARIGDVAGQSYTLEMLGNLRRLMGDAEAEPAYLDAAGRLADLAGDRAGEASIESERAQRDAGLGELELASSEYRRAYHSLRQPRTEEEAREAAKARYGYAMMQLYLNQPEKARAPLLIAQKTFYDLDDSDMLAYARIGLAATWQMEGRADRALAIAQQVLDQMRRTGGTPGTRALALYMLGKAHFKDQPAKAVAELREAASLDGGLGVQKQAQIQLVLAQALVSTSGDAVEQAAERAVALAQRARTPVVEAAALAVRADVDLARHRPREARAAIERAIRLTEDLRAEVMNADQRRNFLAARRNYFETQVEVLAQLDSRAAFDASEHARARDLLDRLTHQQVDVGQIVPADLKQRQHEIEDRIETAQGKLQALTSMPRSGYLDAAVVRLEEDLARNEEAERKLADAIERRHPGYAQIHAVRPPPLALEEVQRLLDARTALLEYFVGKHGSFLFVVTRQGLYLHPVPSGSGAELTALVAGVNRVLDQDSLLHGERFAEDSFKLYQELLQPAAAELAGKTHLLVAPDGPLYQLSFEALLTRSVPGSTRPRDLPYLIRDRAVSYVPSVGVLAQLLRRHRPAPEGAVPALFVGFGDPQPAPPPAGVAARGERGAQRDLPVPLPASGDEVRTIAGLFPPGRSATFLGADASVENVRSAQVAAARFLHFASHARLDDEHPERSGLLLAATGPRRDGLLRVRDVFDLELTADLVVLSACRSGLGKEVPGEGVLGLSRAFLYAGAAGVVVSLWQVDDEATAELMIRFYRHLQPPAFAGDPAEALRQAKLELLRGAPGPGLNYSRPYYWAPFILSGIPR